MVTRYLRFPGGKSKALTFSYDDGVEQDIRLIDLFRRHGLKGTFNLNSGLFGQFDNSRRLTADEVKEVYTPDVCEVACHGAHHGTLAACDTAVACLEVLDDRRALENLFGCQIHGMAYANGSVNDAVESLCASAGIWYGRTVVSTREFGMPQNWLRMPTTCHHNDKQLMELGQKFLDLRPVKNPQMFTVWGHSYQFDTRNNWDVMERFADLMGGREDIWYATNLELYLAWRDYSRLESSADGVLVHNPSPRSVWVGEQNGNCYEIKAGQTIRLE